MVKALRRYEFSERLAEILGGSRRDLRYRVTLMVAGGIMAPGPRGPGSPPATPKYAANLLIGAMAAPQQAHTVEAIRCYHRLRPCTRRAGLPGIYLGSAGTRRGADLLPAQPLLSPDHSFGEVLTRLLDQARAPETRETLTRELHGIRISRGFPAAAVQLGVWLEGRLSIITQNYELAEGARPPVWLDPERGGVADPGLIHSVFLPAAKLIEIGRLTNLEKERKTAMIDIGLTIAKLANLAKNRRYRRSWEKLLSAFTKAKAWTDKIDRQPSRLTEVTGFGSNPGDLQMHTYIPDHLPASAPLVVLLHGCTQNAHSYDEGTGWSTLADRYGFALLMPQQHWKNNPLRCFNWFRTEDTERAGGEALSVSQMVEQMIADHSLDRRRVYVTGVSSGGAMASVMLATYPDLFAGGAIIAGLPYRAAEGLQEAFECMFQGRNRSEREWGDLVRATSSHQGNWPKVSVWHGDADSAVKPAMVDETIKQWRDLHGLEAAPSMEMTVDGHRRQVWQGLNGDDLIESFTIAGMGHGVPIEPGDQAHQCGTAAPFFNAVGISSAHHIARFWGITERETATEATREHVNVALGQISTILVDSAGKAHTEQVSVSAKRPSKERSEQTRGTTSGTGAGAGAGIDMGSIVNRSVEAAQFLKGLGGKGQSGVDVSSIVAKSLEAAGILKGKSPSGSGKPKGGAMGVDISSIVAKSLEMAGVLKGQDEQPPIVQQGDDKPAGKGWEGADWQLLKGDPDALGDKPILFGQALSGTDGIVGHQVKSVSRRITLGERPILSYMRKLDLNAAANEYTTAGFNVLVDGILVDEVIAAGLNHQELEWTGRSGIDLSRFAGRQVTLTFEVTANSNVYIEVFAKAWLDHINIQEIATVEAL